VARARPGRLGRFYPLGYAGAAAGRPTGYRAANGAAGPRPGLRAA
jgi:hypothetical protein